MLERVLQIERIAMLLPQIADVERHGIDLLDGACQLLGIGAGQGLRADDRGLFGVAPNMIDPVQCHDPYRDGKKQEYDRPDQDGVEMAPRECGPVTVACLTRERGQWVTDLSRKRFTKKVNPGTHASSCPEETMSVAWRDDGCHSRGKTGFGKEIVAVEESLLSQPVMSVVRSGKERAAGAGNVAGRSGRFKAG
ncbi:hypothetical protein GCM10007205_26960 [Oxalicibacterium flavum]|uniref:Uncharacterized protein n=1 Tax=Oxalicibacterium flavum TaxID=179467 RepID=A0A8J2UM51_9BURK|nr:hypothetical protein GCM10007205_26960 [Oxalicibacterium flavum]